MTRSLTKSNQHYQRAVRRLPVGVSSNFRAWGEGRTIYVARARGARLWDIDGNEYLDYRLGYGPTILGYADPRVDAAAREGMEIGGTTALSTMRELTVADRIASMVPAAELVRFTNSGTEAVMAALRLARAFTGRQAHVQVEGGFHGMSDCLLWEVKPEDLDKPDPAVKPDGQGVAEALRENVYIVQMNDSEQLENVLRKHGERIATLVIEPILGNAGSIMATAQYLLDARALCDRYGVLMLVDEVKTGFRVARGGVQELMGVRADLCTYAKALANGYPISAIAGREDIMRRIGPGGVAQGGTYAAHPVCLAAADRTLEILDETDALERIAGYGQKLRDGMGSILTRRGVAHAFSGHPAMSGLFFTDSVPRTYREWSATDRELYNLLARQLNDRGILCEPDSREPWFISAAHDEACLAETLEKFEVALAATLDGRAAARRRAPAPSGGAGKAPAPHA
jgi:glutamate-1-semialdehyde 2,1-aminomutase